MSRLSIFPVFLIGLLAAQPAPAQDSRPTKPTANKPADKRVTYDHRAFSALLERHVEGERVDYVGLLRDRAMLETMYSAGLRVSELVGLNDGDLDTEGDILVVRGKGRREGSGAGDAPRRRI